MSATLKSAVDKLPWVRGVSLGATVGLTYFVVAYLSLTGMFFLKSEGITLFWASAGISSGILIALRSRGLWPAVIGIFAAAFAIPFFILGRSVWLATIFALCDSAEPMIIRGLVVRYFGADFALDQSRKVFGLLGATIAGTTPSSLAAAVASRLFLGIAAPVLPTWLHWWTGVTIGVVTVAPFIIGFSAAIREPPPRSEQIEGAAGLLALTGMTGVVIALPQPLWETVLPAALLFPILLWLAARCRPVFAAGGALIVSLALTWTTTFGIGHFGNTGLPVDYRILQAQAIILVLAIGAQTLAALFAERRASDALEARLSERTRIARELHDTLLQSFHGVLLRFHTISRQLQQGRIKEQLDSAIDEAAQAITEGREAVQGLRASVVETNDLAAAFKTFGDELVASRAEVNAPAFTVVVERTAPTMHPIVRDEIYRIGCEALRNAIEHAAATRIEVELCYDTRQLRLRIRDNGKGIDPAYLGEQGRAGHFGLHGMRERARLIGGKLTVWSALDSGTVVELLIPGARAYTASPSEVRS